MNKSKNVHGDVLLNKRLLITPPRPRNLWLFTITMVIVSGCADYTLPKEGCDNPDETWDGTECIPRECQDAALPRCNGDTIETCQSGIWKTDTLCTYGCRAGKGNDAQE